MWSILQIQCGAFNGHIDEVGILDIALTGDEVRNIIANGFVINSNVAGYWDFGSGSGVVLVDQTTNTNNGAITGAIASLKTASIASLPA